MELELGLKITKTKDDIDCISEYQFMKDTGPIFKSRETNTMFILTAHLKGYKRNNIDINISKDGNKISIRGKKPIQEMVMMGWVMQRKVVDVKGFNKIFKIPYGVNLDKIKANYNEEEWMLNIVMPKLVKGIYGLKIEEIKEQDFDKGKEQGKSDYDHVSSSVGETSQKRSKEFEFQHMEGSENIIEKMIDDTKKETSEERIVKEVGEYKLRVEDGNEESVREKGGKEEFEVSKKLERVFMSKEIEDKGQDKEFEDEKLNSRIVEKRLDDDVNRDLIVSTIKKDNEESKLRIKDNKVKDEGQIGFKESMIQQSGELKQNEIGESKCESKVRLKESSEEPFEAMKGPKFDENVVDHIPNDIGCINQNQLKDEYEKEIIKPNKEGFDAKVNINEEFLKMQETKNEKEERVSKEVEYFVEEKKGNNTNETMKNETEESGQQKVAKMKGSKGFNVAKEEEQKEVKKKAFVENESLIVEGDESKEITKEIVKDKEDEIENGIVKMKGEGSTKMHVEPNESFGGENVNNGKIEQTKDVNEKGANIEHSLKKVNGDKYEKIQNEENEGFKRNKTNAEDEGFLQEEMTKGRSKANKATKEDLPMKYFDSPIDTREGQKNATNEKVKAIKESENKSSMKPFEAGEDVHKDFEKPKMESKDGDQESIREKSNREGFDTEAVNEEIQNYFPKSTNEQNEGLNVQKRREIKDLKENVVERNGKEIEYFVEKGEGDRLKSMQDEIEESEYGIKESGQQHANENTVKEMYEVSKSETKELPRQVSEIDGSKEFDVAKEQEKDEVLNEAMVESESLLEMVRGEESNQMTKAIVQDDEDKLEYNIKKLKEKGPAKIQFEPNDPFEGDRNREKIEKEIKNQKLESIDELSENKNANIGIFDGRKTNRFQEMKQTEDVEEKNAKIGKFAKFVNEKIQDEDLKKNTTKEKDQCCLQEETSEGRCQETKFGKEDFSMKMLDSQIDAREGSKSRKGPKDKEIDEHYFAESTTKEELQGSEIETVNQILFNELEENNSKAKEIGTPEREFQSVASTGFKEFDYGNAKDKKQNMTMLPPKFQSKETHESKDEGINQDILNQKKTKEVGTIDDEVVKSLSTQKFQITQQSEVEEKDKGENEEAEQNDNLKQDMRLERELEKGEKGEFLNREAMQEKTQNANDVNFKIHGEITKDGIEKEKCIHETMKTTQEKEAETSESSLKNDVAEVKTKRPLEIEKTVVQWKFPKTKDQHDYGIEEMKLPNIVACQEAKPSKLPRPMNNQQSTEKIKAIGEYAATKDSSKLNIVETAKIDSLQPQLLDVQENVLQKKEEPKVAKIEDKHAPILQREIRKTTQTIEEKELSGSKRVDEKVHDTSNRELQREIEEVASKMVEPSTTVEKTPTEKGERKNPQELTRPNMDYEISKVEVQKENEVENHIHVLEEAIYKEEGTNANEVDSLEASLNNGSVQHEQHDSGTEDIKEPKNATYQEAKTSKLQRPRIKQQSGDEINRKSEENIDGLPPHLLDEQEVVLHVQEKNDKKGFLVEEERVVKKRERPMVAKNEETLKTVSGKSKTKEENKPKMKEITTQFEKANGSKRVEEKVHQTPKREHEKELQEVTSKIEVEAQTTVEKTPIKGVERKEPLELTSPPNMVNEILMVEEKHEEKEGQKHIQVLEAIVPKGKDDRGHQEVQEKNNKIEFQTQKSSEEEKVVKKMEEAKVTKREETKDDCTFKRQDEKTTQASKFDEASSGSKRVGEKVHETSERNHQRELEEVTSRMDNEIPKVKEYREEEERHHELEAFISKEKDIVEQNEDTDSQQNSTVPTNSPRKKHFHSIEDTPTLEIPSTSCTQQFEVEGEEKAKKRGQEIEECINNYDEEAKQGIEEIKDEEKDYEHVFEEEKECEDEKRGGKKDNAKIISKEFFVPLVIAGSALLVTLIAIFVRHRRARKSYEAFKTVVEIVEILVFVMWLFNAKVTGPNSLLSTFSFICVLFGLGLSEVNDYDSPNPFPVRPSVIALDSSTVSTGSQYGGLLY